MARIPPETNMFLHSEKAKEALDILPDSDAKQILLELAKYSINREK